MSSLRKLIPRVWSFLTRTLPVTDHAPAVHMRYIVHIKSRNAQEADSVIDVFITHLGHEHVIVLTHDPDHVMLCVRIENKKALYEVIGLLSPKIETSYERLTGLPLVIHDSHRTACEF